MMAYKEALMKLSHEPWLPFAKTLGTLSPFWNSLRSPVSRSRFGNVASSVILPIFIFEGLVCTIVHTTMFFPFRALLAYVL